MRPLGPRRDASLVGSAERVATLYQQFTASPFFLAGENVHCVTAATTASSDERPSLITQQADAGRMTGL